MSLSTRAARDGKRRGREATGSWHLARARADGRVRACAREGAAAPGGPSGRWSSAAGEESEKGLARKGSRWEGGSSPPSPYPPVCPSRGDRHGDLPARLSRPTSPPRPSRFGSEGSGGDRAPPPRASVSGAGHAPPFATAPPRGASGASRDGWRGGGGGSPVGPLARPVAFPPPALDRFLPGRRSSAPGPPPPRRSPRPVLRARGLSSVVRPALPLSFPPSPPPVCPLPARSPASRRSLPYRPRWREGGPGRGCGARATGGGGRCLGFRRKEGRARARAGGLRPASGTRWGPRRAVAVVVSCGGRPGARPGPRVTGR